MSSPSKSDGKTFAVAVNQDDAGERLDRFLVSRTDGLTRARIQALIKGEQLVRTRPEPAATIAESAYRVKSGESYKLHIPPPKPVEPEAQDIPLDILFEDEHLIVLNKPAGMVVHPAPGNPDRTLVNALLFHCGASLQGIGGELRPGIVHRLDKDTSGVMIAAKSEAAHHGLVAQFSAHSVERIYTALVRGTPHPAKGRIEGNIGRHPGNRKKMAIVTRGGRRAVTHYSTSEVFGVAEGSTASLVRCKLETGRTHQVRVHMASIGHPLLGDPLYGRAWVPTGADQKLREKLGEFRRQALHASVLGFTHPVTLNKLKFDADLPYEMNELVEAFHSADGA